MKKYKATLTRTLKWTVTVEAEDKEDALYELESHAEHDTFSPIQLNESVDVTYEVGDIKATR